MPSLQFASELEIQQFLSCTSQPLAEHFLLEFVRQAWPIVEPEKEFIDGWHIAAICQHLEAVADGKITQLLINVPPATSKSTLVCVLWPAWVWTSSPQTRFLFASYGNDLSIRDSMRCRWLIESEWYRQRWGAKTELCGDMNQKGHFQNVAGGWRMATSVGAKATGYHPHFMAFDDPHKVNEAESETERRAVIDWWDGTMSMRGIIHKARKVGIMQRLHQSDLSGHLLDKGGWDHIELPMRYDVSRAKTTSLGWRDPRIKDGELLWPEVYSEDVVEKLERDMGPYHASGQLQQRPAPRGGGMFKRADFEIIKTMPAIIDKIVRYWDKAGTKGGDGARTAGSLMARCRISGPRGLVPQYVIMDIVKGRWGASEREAIIKQTAETDNARYGSVDVWVEQEPGSGGKESAESTIMNLDGFYCRAERVTGSKETRAEPMSAQAGVGAIKLLAGDWNSEFLNEIELFPVGKFKDQVDSSSGGFAKLHLSSIVTATKIERATSDRTGGASANRRFTI